MLPLLLFVFNLAQQLSGSDFNSEIQLIHLADLQPTAVSFGLNFQ